MSKLPVEKITANVKNKLSKLLLVICRCKTCPLELSRFIPLSIIYSNSSQIVSRTYAYAIYCRSPKQFTLLIY